MLDKQGYMHARTSTRPRARAHAYKYALVMLLFHARGIRELASANSSSKVFFFKFLGASVKRLQRNDYLPSSRLVSRLSFRLLACLLL
jgi:hypothetical protein